MTTKGHAKQPIIGDDDLIYSYKEQVFSGFAPCFANGIYSLACCKGAKNGKGMRQSVCKAIEDGKAVWVLSIAAGGIKHKKHNKSQIDYEPGDAIYLAKIDQICTWQEYSTDKAFSQRKDAYYVLDGRKVTWQKKIKDLHDKEVDKVHDCALGPGNIKGRTAADVFRDDKQILIAREYYVFDKGQQLSGVKEFETLDAARGFKCKDDGKVRRVDALKDFLKNNHAFYCTSGTDPFEGVDKAKGGGCKCR
jgi:hypothetical protein